MWRRRATTGLVVIAVLAGFVLTLNRPWLEQWGSTAAERSARLAGDDIVAAPSAIYTRSISITAPTSKVWPWLVQMGQDKGGFYSFDWAETLFTDPMRNASTIRPEWQQLQVGDFVHPFPPDRDCRRGGSATSSSGGRWWWPPTMTRGAWRSTCGPSAWREPGW